MIASVIAVALVAMLCGSFNAVIIAALNPGHNIFLSFVGYGLWGPILVARGVCAYGISLALGTILRRVGPSVALGFVVSAVVVFSSLITARSVEPARIIANGDPAASDALGVTSGILMPDGSFQTYNDCVAPEPVGLSLEQRTAWDIEHCSQTAFYLPGSQMPTVEARESAALALFGLAGLAGTFKLIASRRP